jgi:hypothetical protein
MLFAVSPRTLAAAAVAMMLAAVPAINRASTNWKEPFDIMTPSLTAEGRR